MDPKRANDPIDTAGPAKPAMRQAMVSPPIADNPIDTAGPVKAMVSNLFYGWGYNFYRKENRLRADDLLVRGKVSDLLGEARSHLARLEADFRRERLPAPTREQPFPDRTAVQTADALQRVQKDIEAIEVKVRNASVPEMDRVHQPHRNERDTLEKLAAVDEELVACALVLREGIVKLRDGTAAASETPRLLESARFEALWHRREEVLSILR